MHAHHFPAAAELSADVSSPGVHSLGLTGVDLSGVGPDAVVTA